MHRVRNVRDKRIILGQLSPKKGACKTITYNGSYKKECTKKNAREAQAFKNAREAQAFKNAREAQAFKIINGNIQKVLYGAI